ncbi:YncE family protein [Fodinibius salsisoli]|uniref:YncE family protein n=1 Tax=Fodinibius salsisoli TaxID=2820877 RepID=A0ABT3PS06_9BACT|nr:YncE family protein [Fodinibius salsisoli]MCW9708632.1 YncE family protein [Fodinibius salsisoli]
MKCSFFTLLFALCVCAFQSTVAQTHHIYVTAESDDKVYEIAFNANTQQGNISDVIPVGEYPTETEGPHGINIGLDGNYWYLSVAHGTPYGWLYKFKTGSNEFVSRTELGMFPASMEVSSVTGLLYVVNFNLHGDMEPSTVSVVDPEAMAVVADITTGIMPHGSRITTDGKFQYHVSMMTDELMEINTANMEISRRLNLNSNPSSTPDKMANGTMPAPVVKPTWADPHPSQDLVYVAGNGSDEILEIDTKAWEVSRRFKSGKAPYNLEVSNNGKWLVASYKGEGATGVWNLESGQEVAKITNSRKVTHGVTISPDSHFAFISVEGVGGEAGSVEVINLLTQKRVEVIEVGKQAGGIIYWKKTD